MKKHETVTKLIVSMNTVPGVPPVSYLLIDARDVTYSTHSQTSDDSALQAEMVSPDYSAYKTAPPELVTR
ncbi:hypothetical protein Trydic_g21616 [Trypoxylus dichotomus]